jgi:hypothetical protein
MNVNNCNESDFSGNTSIIGNTVLSAWLAVPWLKQLVTGFPPWRPRFEPRSGYVVDKVALGQVFSNYFGFPCQSSFHQLVHTHHLSSGASAIGQLVANVPSRLSLSPPQEKNGGGGGWLDCKPHTKPTAKKQRYCPTDSDGVNTADVSSSKNSPCSRIFIIQVMIVLKFL